MSQNPLFIPLLLFMLVVVLVFFIVALWFLWLNFSFWPLGELWSLFFCSVFSISDHPGNTAPNCPKFGPKPQVNVNNHIVYIYLHHQLILAYFVCTPHHFMFINLVDIYLNSQNSFVA